MRRTTVYFTGLAAAAALLSGCAQTPDHEVVRGKGSRSIAEYREADETPETIAGDPVSPEGESGAAGAGDEAAGADSAARSGNSAAGENPSVSVNVLAQRLQVPERYTASASSEDGAFELNCDAQILVPNADKVSVWKVRQREFTQEMIDRVTETFFGDLPVWNGGTYFTYTKGEALTRLNQLKAWQAEGNTDPYGVIAEAEAIGDMFYADSFDLQDMIDRWEAIYAEAPEEKDRTEVAPGLGNSFWINTEGGDTGREYQEGYFDGAVEMDDKTYTYRLKTWDSAPMEIEILRMGDDNLSDSGTWFVPDAANSNSSFPPREEMRAMPGITPEEAQCAADAYVEKLGLSQEFSAKSTNLCVCMGTDDAYAADYRLRYVGWQVDYTRDIDGFPVTDENQEGGGLESMDDTTTVPWCYERLEITVDAQGLLHAYIRNLYEVEEKQIENVEMLPFPEIAGIFEQMMRIQNAELDYETYHGFSVDRVELGYMRIYDPGTDSRSGLMVPVWDFFGTRTARYDYNGEAEEYTNDNEHSSFMTVNAADGTVIDRNLGY